MRTIAAVVGMISTLVMLGVLWELFTSYGSWSIFGVYIAAITMGVTSRTFMK